MSDAKKRKINRIKKKVRDYVDLLEKDDFPVSEAYIYGSYAKGNFRQNSDIDVCIVSEKYNLMDDKIVALLWNKTRQVDYRIEPYGFLTEDFQDACNPMASEIKKTGIRIA